MAAINKKRVRACVAQHTHKSTQEILALYAAPMTDIECAAYERILRARQVPVPAEHGPVTEDETAQVQRVITAQELQVAAVGVERRKTGMGLLEWVSMAVGMGVVVATWQMSTMQSVGLALVASLAVYGVGRLVRGLIERRRGKDA